MDHLVVNPHQGYRGTLKCPSGFLPCDNMSFRRTESTQVVFSGPLSEPPGLISNQCVRLRGYCLRAPNSGQPLSAQYCDYGRRGPSGCSNARFLTRFSDLLPFHVYPCFLNTPIFCNHHEFPEPALASFRLIVNHIAVFVRLRLAG